MDFKKNTLIQKSATLEESMWEYLDKEAKKHSKGNVVINKNEVLRAILRDHMKGC